MASEARTVVVPVDAQAPEPGAIADAARILAADGLVAFPTETVYGLGGRALSETAVARIFAAKGRPTTHPLIAHVEGEEGARSLARVWPDLASRLARAFWPGPLTLVVERAEAVPAAVAGGGNAIAIRAPAHPVALALVRALGEPIAAPSANAYQAVSPTRADHVLRSLEGRIAMVLDGGPTAQGIESTVVDVRGDLATVLRPGALSLADLRRVAGTVRMAEGAVSSGAARPSPGMDARHYSPRATLEIVTGRTAAMRRAMSLAEQHARGGSRGSVGLLLRRDPATSVEVRGLVVEMLAEDAEGYGRELFAALHRFDDADVVTVVVEAVPTDEAWWAVADRLMRAAAR